MIFLIFDFLTKPKNLIEEAGLHVVDNDDATCSIYSQNSIGIWSFAGIIRRSRYTAN